MIAAIELKELFNKKKRHQIKLRFFLSIFGYCGRKSEALKIIKLDRQFKLAFS